MSTNWRELRKSLFPSESEQPFSTLDTKSHRVAKQGDGSSDEPEPMVNSVKSVKSPSSPWRVSGAQNCTPMVNSAESAKSLEARLIDLEVRVEFSESMRRLESMGVCIAVWEDGTMRVLINNADTIQTIDVGGCIYSANDMWHYIQLEPHERRMLHAFKKQFAGGTIEWKREKLGSEHRCEEKP